MTKPVVVITCKECGHVIKEFYKLPTPQSSVSYNWYDLLFNELDGKCPKCGHTLPNPEQYAELTQLKIQRRDAENTMEQPVSSDYVRIEASKH